MDSHDPRIEREMRHDAGSRQNWPHCLPPYWLDFRPVVHREGVTKLLKRASDLPYPKCRPASVAIKTISMWD
jgi:hypothetical protein